MIILKHFRVRNWLIFALYLAALPFVLIFLLVTIGWTGRFDELGSYREWSTVAWAERQYGNTDNANRITVIDESMNDIPVIIIKMNNSKPGVIIANARYIPTVKTNNISRLRLSEAEFKDIQARTSLSDDVKTYLQNAVE